MRDILRKLTGSAGILLLCLSLCLPALADKTVTITFTGDVTLGSEEAYKDRANSFVTAATEKGYDYFFAKYQDMFQNDDLTVVNLEGPLTDSSRNENKSKTFRFRGPTDFVKILTRSGIEACNISNNHTGDFGEQGMESTKTTLTEAGVGWFGGTDTYIFEKDGIKIAFFGENSTVVNRNRKWMTAEITRLKEEEGVNAVVAVFHAGTEYAKKHGKNQKNYAEMAIDAGADLVIMHHPHVVQGIAVYNNRSICWSLGNFCFGGNAAIKHNAIESLVVSAELTFSDDGTYLGQQLSLYPAYTSGTTEYNDFQPHPVTGEEAEAVLKLVQNDTSFTLEPYDEATGCAKQLYVPAQGE